MYAAAVTQGSRRRVLFVSHVFPPQVAGGAARMGQFARLLPEYGWEVSVLTARHGDAIDRGEANAVAQKTRIIDAPSPMSSVIKRGQPAPRRGIEGLVRRVGRTATRTLLFPDREVLWIPGALEAATKLLREVKHDAVFASYGPASNLIVGLLLARKFGIPLVSDFRDLWSTLPLPVFASPVHRAAAHRLERLVVRSSTRVTAVSPLMAEGLAEAHGVPPERAISITNGFDPADFARVHDSRPLGLRPFRLIYSGSVPTAYDLGPFWRAVQSLARASTITPATFKLEFVGNLATSDLRSYGIDDFVETRPFVPHDQVFDTLSRGDALLMIETPGYYARMSYAAKVFDYVLTGKPVMGLVEDGGNTWRLLRALDVAYCADPRDEHAIANTLRDVLTTKGASPHPVEIDRAPLHDFRRDILANRLADVLNDAIAAFDRSRSAVAS